MSAPAVFVLSLDTEIAWGTFDQPEFASYAPAFDQYRALIDRLLALLDRYQVPATWAFVGHLLLDRCQRAGGTTHPEVLRPNFAWYPGDWHDHDPGTDLARDPWWYGTDILAKVRAATVDHEVGTHTFSHVVLGDPACDAATARSQLAACRELHQAHGLPFDSLVFPRNQVAHLEVCAELGLIAWRGREQAWYEGLRGRWHRLGHLADRLLATTPAVYPRAQLQPDARGLVNVPGSMFLLPYDGVRARIPTGRRVRQGLRGLRAAVASEGLFHLWFHPFNLGSSPRMFDALEAILVAVAAEQAAGRLVVRTMAQVAREARGE
ncbi:MAG: polysaccharide deacetylase family protein [Fimbriimonadaceae bacterium]|nr:polysaccharide deacetylase family protein [Fimbriimonadaceae bacterium]